MEKVFGKNEDGAASKFEWNLITDTEEVDDIILASNEKKQVLFKHSNSCAVSFFARRSLESFPDSKKDLGDFYMVDVIKNRPVSKYIAEKLGIRHESPQLFIIEDGEVLWHGSHRDVKVDRLDAHLKE